MNNRPKLVVIGAVIELAGLLLLFLVARKPDGSFSTIEATLAGVLVVIGMAAVAVGAMSGRVKRP